MSTERDLFGGPSRMDYLDGDDREAVADLAQWPQDLADILTLLEKRLIDRGYAAPEAHGIAEDCILVIAFQAGGRMLYLPKAERLRRAIRDRQIFQRFRNDNYDALALEFDLSVQAVYRIIKKQTRLAIALRQASLF